MEGHLSLDAKWAQRPRYNGNQTQKGGRVASTASIVGGGGGGAFDTNNCGYVVN